MEGIESNWTELVEDLIEGGDIDKAISVLESFVSKQQASADTNFLQLSFALFDLSNLYSLKGFSSKADESRTSALLFRERSRLSLSTPGDLKIGNDDAIVHDGSSGGKATKPLELKEDVFLSKNYSDEDDWEATADREAIADNFPNQRWNPLPLPEVSKLSLDDADHPMPKRRGRGTFSYQKDELYSDQLIDAYPKDDDDDDDDDAFERQGSEKDSDSRNLKYRTEHVLVLADFPPSTTTGDLEKLLGRFRSSDFVIRWINDTAALAVFTTPSLALEAFNCLKYAFTVRVLEVDDALWSSIRHKDLDPPRQRPQTSIRTAQRLIAQGMGLKLKSTEFGSKELRIQEEARKDRIVSRQRMKEDAWGDD